VLGDRANGTVELLIDLLRLWAEVRGRTPSREAELEVASLLTESDRVSDLLAEEPVVAVAQRVGDLVQRVELAAQGKRLQITRGDLFSRHGFHSMCVSLAADGCVDLSADGVKEASQSNEPVPLSAH